MLLKFFALGLGPIGLLLLLILLLVLIIITQSSGTCYHRLTTLKIAKIHDKKHAGNFQKYP